MSDDENEPTTVKLRANDSERDFELSYRAAKVSDLVTELTAAAQSDGSSFIELTRVEEPTLAKVVEFLVHHLEDPMNEIPTPLETSTFDETVTQVWYRDYVRNLVHPMTYDLLTAANYMGIKPLLDLACLTVTFELAGKNAEEIRTLLNLPELTPEEEASARTEHRWIFENPGE